MNSPQFVHPIEPDVAMEAIETLARPLRTLLDNFDKGQLQTNNRTVTLAALESALSGCRIAYTSLRGAENVK